MAALRWRILAFVCPHGALKSRLAAAYFNLDAPPGWRAVSAGLHPQENVSAHAAPLLAGTAAAPFLDADPPRELSTDDVSCVVAIDCEVGGATMWQLANGEPGDAMREEIASLVEQLVADFNDVRQ
jgi:protein-tyrosine-phosphatase